MSLVLVNKKKVEIISHRARWMWWGEKSEMEFKKTNSNSKMGLLKM